MQGGELNLQFWRRETEAWQIVPTGKHFTALQNPLPQLFVQKKRDKNVTKIVNVDIKAQVP